MKKTVEERFWEKVEKIDGGCWVWRGPKNKWGFGAFWDGLDRTYAHRYAFKLLKGFLPTFELKRTCSSLGCVNPDHFSEGCLRGASVEDQFWAKVEKTEGCWNWLGSKNGHGYGHFRNKNTKSGVMRAHRYSYQLLKGPLIPGLSLDHICRNTSCVNPDHLEQVTHRENVLRGASPHANCARKTKCPSGHPYSEINTYISPRGGRECKICKRRNGTLWMRGKRAKIKDKTSQEDQIPIHS